MRFKLPSGPTKGPRLPNSRDELRLLSTDKLRELAAVEQKPPYLSAWLEDELRYRHGGAEVEPVPRQHRGKGPRYWRKRLV